MTVRLTLVAIDFDAVRFVAHFADGRRRPVTVLVGSGASWADAVRFPSVGAEAATTLGDDELDQLVRDRAGEELVRLGASRAA